MKRMKKRRKGPPIAARTSKALRALRRDNLASGDFWMWLDLREVTFAAQIVGHQPTAKITIPRRHFDRFVRWYTTGINR